MVTIFKDWESMTDTSDENVKKSNLFLKEEKWGLRTSIP